MYRNQNSSIKQDTRQNVLEYLKPLRKTKPRVLSLPHKDFLFEKMVKNRYKHAVIDCVENNIEIYTEVSKKEIPVDSYNYKDIFNELRDNSQKYDLVWLDLCCTLKIEIFNNIIDVVQNHLKKNSVLAITLTAARERRTSLLSDIYGVDLKTFRVKTLPNLITEYAKQVHPNFRLDRIISYKGETYAKSLPMNLYIFNL